MPLYTPPDFRQLFENGISNGISNKPVKFPNHLKTGWVPAQSAPKDLIILRKVVTTPLEAFRRKSDSYLSDMLCFGLLNWKEDQTQWSYGPFQLHYSLLLFVYPTLFGNWTQVNPKGTLGSQKGAISCPSNSVQCNQMQSILVIWSHPQSHKMLQNRTSEWIWVICGQRQKDLNI